MIIKMLFVSGAQAAQDRAALHGAGWRLFRDFYAITVTHPAALAG
jgi:hypothetical protein